MKILFWNIGKTLNEGKQTLISEAIISQSPDVFCIAEGSQSKESCQLIVDIFSANSYSCYYSPLFSDDPRFNLDYKYIKNGLKIFIKNKDILKDSFAFENQRKEGRIVYLKIVINLQLTTIVFLHNHSKAGNREVTDKQRSFIIALKDMIKIGQIANDTARLVIIGDFNLEPWDNILRHDDFLQTSFIGKHNSQSLRKTRRANYYFNPIAEMIFDSKIENLGGTYFSENNGWALFDYCLYETNDMTIDYDVLTEINANHNLLNDDKEIHTNFLLEDIDHLPILMQIKN